MHWMHSAERLADGGIEPASSQRSALDALDAPRGEPTPLEGHQLSLFGSTSLITSA